MFRIEFAGIIFKEGKTYVSYCPELDVSSCGNTINEARENLKIAVNLFLEEAEKMGIEQHSRQAAGYLETTGQAAAAVNFNEINIALFSKGILFY